MLLGIFCSDKDEIYCYTVIVTIIIIEMSMIYLVTYVRCHCIIVLYYFRIILKNPLHWVTLPNPTHSLSNFIPHVPKSTSAIAERDVGLVRMSGGIRHIHNLPAAVVLALEVNGQLVLHSTRRDAAG